VSPQANPSDHAASRRCGAVSPSSFRNQAIACSLDAPHISAEGRSPAQKAGRSGRPKIRQRFSSSSWTHRTPAGLPLGIPGIGLVIEGAMQQAPQPVRHSMLFFL
jgi:hypothetical protein